MWLAESLAKVSQYQSFSHIKTKFLSYQSNVLVFVRRGSYIMYIMQAPVYLEKNGGFFYNGSFPL